MRRPAGLLLLLVTLAILSGACANDPARSALMTEGRTIYRDAGCVACHGGKGEGGVGPPLTQVMATFPTCNDHVRWVQLGSLGWQEEVGDTYGATDKPVKLGMPGFAEQLTDAQLRTVVAYERVELGGLDEASVRSDCGI